MKRRPLIILVIVLLLVIGGVAAALLVRHHRHSVGPATTAHTTSTLPTAQDTFSNGDSRNGTSTTSNNTGGATDTNGNQQTSPGTPLVSSSGAVTVNNPLANSTVTSGLNLNGTAQVDSLNYRVIDDQVGVIAQGELRVNNGKYSGNLVFTSHATTGRIDVFSYSDAGAETNEINIPVHFK